MPDTNERRPGDESGAAVSTISGGRSKLASTVAADADNNPPRWRCRHARQRFCLACVRQRRRNSRELAGLLAEQRHPPEPSTFGLGDGELRREANRLAAAGWPVDEVSAVLDVQPRQAAQ